MPHSRLNRKNKAEKRLLEKFVPQKAKHHLKKRPEPNHSNCDYWYDLGWKNLYIEIALLFLFYEECFCNELVFYLLWNQFVCACVGAAVFKKKNSNLEYIKKISKLTNIITIIMVMMNFLMLFLHKNLDPTHFAFFSKKQAFAKLWFSDFASSCFAFLSVIFFYGFVSKTNLERLRIVHTILTRKPHLDH